MSFSSLLLKAVFCVDQTAILEQQRLATLLSQVQREKAVFEGEKNELLRKIGVGSVQSSSEMDAKARELEERVHDLQSQLTEAYRKNSTNVEKMLLAVSGAQEKEAEAARLKERTAELSASVDRMTRELKEREVSIFHFLIVFRDYRRKKERCYFSLFFFFLVGISECSSR